jgi:uroporphyrinogen decarboxylase
MRTKNKRSVVKSLLQNEASWNYTPAAFFTHFPPECHSGRAAIDKHIEFFKYTGMDFVKIQYEKAFPKIEDIKVPKDWRHMPFYDSSFFAEPLEIVESLVKELHKESLIVQTIYSPFMCAADSTSYDLLTTHLQEDPDSVKKGLSVIRDSLLGFIRECARLGIDGFYSSTQGGEGARFKKDDHFQNHISPFDISLLAEMNALTAFNILHICDYWLPYDSVDFFVNYPCKVVSLPTTLKNGHIITPGEAYKQFGKPILGGLNRKGAIAAGPVNEIEQEVKSLLADSPNRYILGADCTVANADWDLLRFAISLAHDHKCA